MSYWQLFYHVVWSTHQRRPLLTAEIEPLIYRYIRFKAGDLGGMVHALNGTQDHTHLVVTIPPKIAVAKFVGQVKGVASARFNKEHPGASAFAWQSGYGALTFDAKRLPYVIAYVERQKEHHAAQATIPVLERATDDEVIRTVGEISEVYVHDYKRWLEEMARQ
jgi:REP element-mobilizing transposase RayT